MKTKTSSNYKSLFEDGAKFLVESLKFIPQARFLDGDFGIALLQEYNGRAEKDYNNSDALKVLSYDGVVKGSNPFAVVLVNQIIRKQGLRTATQADLEKILKTNAINLRGFYEDSALVLRSEDNPNPYLANHLLGQAEQKLKMNLKKMPLMIPLNGLELVNDSNSPYNLAFKLREDAEIIHTPILNKANSDFSSENINEETGLPRKLGEGNRRLCTRNSGLSRLYLYRYLDLDSSGDDLADSGGDGRVVVVSAEGTSQKILDEYKIEIDNKYQKEITRLTKIKDNAIKALSK